MEAPAPQTVAATSVPCVLGLSPLGVVRPNQRRQHGPLVPNRISEQVLRRGRLVGPAQQVCQLSRLGHHQGAALAH